MPYLTDEEIDDVISDNVADNAWNATLNGDDIRLLPRHWRAVRTTFWLYLESQNGGLHQFLWNDNGDAIDLTLEDLSYIGADIYREVLGRAKALYDQETYPNRTHVQTNSWDEFTRGYKIDEMLNLSREFWSLHNTKPLPDFITDFVRQHRIQFQTQDA